MLSLLWRLIVALVTAFVVDCLSGKLDPPKPEAK